MYRDNFDERSLHVLDWAVQESQERNQNHVSVAHLLAALAERERHLYGAVMSLLKADPGNVKLLISSGVESSPNYAGGGVRLDQSVKNLFGRALSRARARGRIRIAISDLFVSLFQDERGGFIEILREAGYDCNDAAEKVWTFFQGYEQESKGLEDSSASRLPFTVGERVRIKSGAFAAFTGEVKEVDVGKSTVKVHLPSLDRFGAVEMNFKDIEKLAFVDQ